MTRLPCLLPVVSLVACGGGFTPRDDATLTTIADGMFERRHEVNHPAEGLPASLVASLSGDGILVRGESQTEKRPDLAAPPCSPVRRDE